MGRIHAGLSVWNLLVLAGAFALGFLRGHVVEPRMHLLAGLFAAIFCCLVHAIVFAHFIGSGKWIKRGVDSAGMDAALVRRTKRFKAKVFPFALFSMLFVVATAVLGGGADQGVVSPTVHLVFAATTMALNVLAAAFERGALLENGEIIAKVAEANRRRVEQGIPPEAMPSAAMEAVRAGSRVFLFLAANVWLLWAYRRFVLRRPSEPVIPYVVGCAILAFVGWRMLVGERAEREATSRGA
jgi:hypothetical protein